MEHLRDEDLVQLCLDGDDSAFEVLVGRYEKQVFSLAYRLSGNYDDAADAAQESFIRIYNMLHKYDASKRFFPWMYRVAHNTCLNSLAKKPAHTVDIHEYGEVIADTSNVNNQPEASYSNIELKENIDKAIDALPEKYRDPVFLRYIENMTYQEIADSLDLPVSTIETRLYRGRNLLQKELLKYIKTE